VKNTNLTPRSRALSDLLNKWSPRPETETIYITDALGRVLSEDAYSLLDNPVYRASMMDGVCVRSELFADGVPDTSRWTRGVERLAGEFGDK